MKNIKKWTQNPKIGLRSPKTRLLTLETEKSLVFSGRKIAIFNADPL